MAAEREYVGWQFRYVFEDQGNRRAEWSGVLEGEPTFTSGYRSYNGWNRHFYHEVRRVYADAVEPYIEDPHNKPDTAGVTGTGHQAIPPAGTASTQGKAASVLEAEQQPEPWWKDPRNYGAAEFASPAPEAGGHANQQLRMLTDEEEKEAHRLALNQRLSYPEAVQRKFCEVNGLQPVSCSSGSLETSRTSVQGAASSQAAPLDEEQARCGGPALCKVCQQEQARVAGVAPAPSDDEIRKVWNRTQDPIATVRAFLPSAKENNHG